MIVTAVSPVRAEIIRRLGMTAAAVVGSGFDRPHIRLSVERVEGTAANVETIVARIGDLARPGIVYPATRRQTHEIAQALNEGGVTTVAYHAGLSGRDREAAQADWISGSSCTPASASRSTPAIRRSDGRVGMVSRQRRSCSTTPRIPICAASRAAPENYRRTRSWPSGNRSHSIGVRSNQR